MPKDTLFRKIRSPTRPTSIRRSRPESNAASAASGSFAVEPDVPSEVVPRPERDADEGQVALERDPGDAPERAVAPGHPERLGVRGAGELFGVLSVPKDVRLDPARLGLAGQIAGVGAPAAGARIHDQ